MRHNKGLRTIVSLLAKAGLVVFGCTTAFTAWLLTISLRAEDPLQSPLNPVGVIAFMIVLIISVAVVLWSAFTLYRENRWTEEELAPEKQKNNDDQ